MNGLDNCRPVRMVQPDDDTAHAIAHASDSTQVMVPSEEVETGEWEVQSPTRVSTYCGP